MELLSPFTHTSRFSSKLSEYVRGAWGRGKHGVPSDVVKALKVTTSTNEEKLQRQPPDVIASLIGMYQADPSKKFICIIIGMYQADPSKKFICIIIGMYQADPSQNIFCSSGCIKQTLVRNSFRPLGQNSDSPPFKIKNILIFPNSTPFNFVPRAPARRKFNGDEIRRE